MTKFLQTKLLFALIALPSLALANFSVSPVKLTLKPTDKVASLTITNNGDMDTKFQLNVVKWTKVDGKDEYLPSTDLTATPLMFHAPAGKNQVIRIALKKDVRGDTEQSYRLFIKELPPQKNIKENSVHVAMEFSVPVFISPTMQGTGTVDCTLADADKKSMALKCKNSHNEHAVVSTLNLSNDKGEPVEHPVGQYILPGGTMEKSIEKAPGSNPTKGALNIMHKGTSSTVDVPVSGATEVNPTK